MSDASLVAMATRLIAKRGRSMTLRRTRSATPTDASRPWLGYADTPTSTTVEAVVLPIEDRSRFGLKWQDGDLVQQGDEDAFISGESVASGDIRPGDLLIDGSVTYTVKESKHYRPGATSILWQLGVRR